MATNHSYKTTQPYLVAVMGVTDVCRPPPMPTAWRLPSSSVSSIAGRNQVKEKAELNFIKVFFKYVPIPAFLFIFIKVSNCSHGDIFSQYDSALKWDNLSLFFAYFRSFQQQFYS